MKITPMGITTPNWPELETFVTNATDISPIRFFDENKISVGSIYSHIVALELFLGNEITLIQDADRSLSHIHLSVAIECEDIDVVLFNDIFAQKITRSNRVNRRETYYILMSMTLREWKTLVIEHCQRKSDPMLRKLFNNFYDLLCQSKLTELFGYFDRENLTDGTFILR